MKIRFAACLVFVLVVAFSFAAPARAQTQTGAINGVVRDPVGAALEGVTVTISGPSMMGTTAVTTDDSGRFRFPNLLPGRDYAVAVTHDGFQSKQYESVVVEVGQTTSVNVELELAPRTEVVVVDGSQVAIIDVTSASAATHFGPDLLRDLPVTERTWEDVVLLSPGVIDGSEPGRGTMFSARGASVVDNQSALDGVINTSPQANTEAAGIAYEAIAELQVLSGALPAEIGNVAGEYTNVVTKSGGNDFHGDAAIYYEGGGLQSNNVDSGLEAAGIEPTLLTGYQDWAVNVGGRIIRDKLWFNAAAAARDRSEDISGFPDDLTLKNDYFLGKVTWQPRPAHRFVAMYNVHNSDLNHFANTPLPLNGPEATRQRPVDNDLATIKWTGVLSDSAFVDVDFGMYKKVTGNLFQDDAGYAYADLVTGTLVGGAFSSNVFDEPRRQLKGSLSLFADGPRGSHDVKLGGEYENSATDLFSFTPSPILAHLLFAGEPGLVVTSNASAGVSTKSKTRGLHAYVQDNWQVSNRVNLNVGLRLNTWNGSFPVQSTPGFSYGAFVDFPPTSVDQEIDALDWASVDPRVAAVIALDDQGRTVVRAAWSRYHHGIAITYFQLGNPNGYSTATHPWVDFNGNFFADPDEVLPAVATAFATGGGIDPNLEQPYTDEFTVGFEKELADELALTVNAYYRDGKNLIEDTNTSAGADSFVPLEIQDPGPDTIPGTPDDQVLTVFNQVSDFDNVLEITNPDNAERKSKGLELILTKRFSNRWQAMGSMVWQSATGTVSNTFAGSIGIASAFNDPNYEINLNGPLGLDRLFQLKGAGSYEGPLGFMFSGYLEYVTGVPVNRELTVVLNQGAIGVIADPKDSHREDDIARLDLRVEKVFAFGARQTSIAISLDALNVFNGGAVTLSNPNGGTVIPGAGYLPPDGGFAVPLTVQPPRIIRLGARLSF